MTITEHIKLAPYTTFRIGGDARFFCIISDARELEDALVFARSKKLSIFVLGGGSNILVSDNGYDGLVIKMENKGVSFSEHGSDILAIAEAGENWDSFVGMTVSRGLYGIENLSLIPGTVGAAPIQNIGAYGVEAKDIIVWVEALEVATGKIVRIDSKDCGFKYRSSMFKENAGKYIVLRVAFRLYKNAPVNTSYPDLKKYFETNVDVTPKLETVREAVIVIRTAKLPDVKQWHTAGSFFKNPIITSRRFIELREKYPELPSFPVSLGRVKIPLGWVLDKICGVRGIELGKAGTYEKQALVIVAHDGATALDVLSLADELARQVRDKTGIEIEKEVQIVY